MEDAFRWLASWVSAEANNGGSVKATDFKDSSVKNTHAGSFDNWKSWTMGPAGSFVRLAGVSGALAIGFGAYGAHNFRDNVEVPRERILAFDSGNRYHLIHSVALLAVPMSKYPTLTGTLFTVGIALFSGSCYYYAITGQPEARRVTPYGGLILILAWLSFVA